MSYPDDCIVIVCDGAAWHKSGMLKTFPNIELMFIPPYTLMLASPVKFDGRLTQYVGRLNRSYKDKTSVIVYDYVDSHISILISSIPVV